MPQAAAIPVAEPIPDPAVGRAGGSDFTPSCVR